MPAAAGHTQLERMCPGSNRILVTVNDQPRSDFLREAVAKFDHLFEFVTRVHVEERKGKRARMKRFACKVDKNA